MEVREEEGLEELVGEVMDFPAAEGVLAGALGAGSRRSQQELGPETSEG